ncbi:MAG: PorP/SprF family type IX secretion system membrane protein [Bacteroidia bacterium]|nr:PorP/SprF family type IX secretion system membrane protein [Bacteroidia bacterium]
MRKLLSAIVLTLCMGMSASAQVYFQNTMYSFNQFAYNPAAAGFGQLGMGKGLNLTLLGRQQWLGIQGAPRLSTLTLNAPADNLGGGIGASLVVDQLGPLTSTGMDFAYAFHLLGRGADEGLRLSIGVSGGFRQTSLNGDWIYDNSNGIDPVLPGGRTSALIPSLNAGLYLTNAEGRFFVGLSGQNLLEPSIEGLLLDSRGEVSTVPRSFFLIGGYRFDLGAETGKSTLTPTIMTRTDGIFPPQVDLNLYWNYKPVVFGAGYRFFNDSFSAMMGVNISDRTFVAYSYDYTTNSLNAVGDVNTHELIISYTFPGSEGKEAKKVDILDNPDKL